MAKPAKARTGKHLWTLEAESEALRLELTARPHDEGRFMLRLAVESARGDALVPGPVKLWTEFPTARYHGIWTTEAEHVARFLPTWQSLIRSDNTSGAPVMALFDDSGGNRIAAAASDALNAVSLNTNLIEERNGVSRVELVFLSETVTPLTRYETQVLVDFRKIPYYRVLRDVSDWWASLPGMTPAPVPTAAREPLYSTWYAMHQELDPAEIEKQCRLARELGCRVVIVDDGWQTLDASRGYAYCGDWEPCPEKMGRMAEHVARVQAMGMKYMLWYSVPYVGVHAKAFERFKDKHLGFPDWSANRWVILDPRFADVREYLIGIYERALSEWNLDGFKLDFVDSFSHGEPERMRATGDGRDCDSVNEASDRLLAEINRRLRAVKPDILIEFRQSYIGPMMRKYGNMFRAADCPNDYNRNRFRTLTVRLLCGATAAHADMFLWHPTERVRNVAKQFIHTLFAVPQVSVLLDKVPREHVEAVRTWLGFFREHRDVLMEGELEPLHPALGYPVVRARTREKMILAAYADMPAPVPADAPEKLLIVNGSTKNRVLLDVEKTLGKKSCAVFDATGKPRKTRRISLSRGIRKIPVPESGYAVIA